MFGRGRKEIRGEGRGGKGRGRHARPRPTRAARSTTKNPKFIRQREREREVGVATDDTRDTIQNSGEEGGREEGGHCVMKEQKNNDMFREVRGRPDMTSTRRERGHEIRKSCS